MSQTPAKKQFSGHEQPDIPKLIRMVPNKFMLAIAVSKRAKQIKEGVKPLILVDEDSMNYPIDIALKEIELGHVKIAIKEKQTDDGQALDEMDQLLDKEIAAAVLDPEEDKKLAVKEKNKPKSKSLAA